MTSWRLVTASLVGHWRLNAAIGAGVGLTTAVLCGALSVGESVKDTLARLHGERLGRLSEVVVMPEDRFVRRELGRELAEDLERSVAALLEVRGSCVGKDEAAASLQVGGVEPAFFELGPEGTEAPALPALPRSALQRAWVRSSGPSIPAPK